MTLTAAERLHRYLTRTGWHDGIPEGHYAIPDPHEPELVTSWRVKGGRLTPWPKEARNGPQVRARRHEVPRDRGQRAAFWAGRRAARNAYLAQVRDTLRAAPEQAAARYASLAFRCTLCNRALRVAESNAYGVGPECREWMPEGLLAEYTRQVASVRGEIQRGTETSR